MTENPVKKIELPAALAAHEVRERPEYTVVDTKPERSLNRLVKISQGEKPLITFAYSIDAQRRRLNLESNLLDSYDIDLKEMGHMYIAGLRAMYAAMKDEHSTIICDELWIKTAMEEIPLHKLFLQLGAQIVVRGEHAPQMAIPGHSNDIKALSFPIDAIEAALARYDKEFPKTP